MTRFLIRSILSLSVIPVLLPECTADNSPETGKESRVFNFIVTDPQKQQINSSRGEQYEITDPLPRLEYNGRDYTIDRFEIRGDNTLNFERKGFGVNMGDKILLYNPYNQTERKYEEFKLLAMVYDYTYIENSIATGLLRATGLWPVLSFFTEVRLNGHTQGLYHFIEDPVEYYIEKENSSCVIRRGYDHVIKSFSINPGRIQNAGYYKERFRKIYNILPDYSGSQMFDTLSSYLDLNQYFTKLSVDLLLKNGDYTDETFFYCKMKNGKQIFGVFPWDYDDLFSDEPHEIGNWWATGTVFGSREYYSMEDVVADVGSRLLFSIEDDLDYKIAKDEFLYHEYLLTLRSVMVKIDIDKIDNIFDKTLEDIGPFYENDSIIAQSKYDVHQTTQSLFLANLAQKRQMLKERRNWITGEIEKQLAEK
ncbi:MAG TPA: CotH kinase family protein [Bacteroidales bacterium]|nr:CotH kinase family protein [Bacteroidales bacterium]